MEDKELKVKCSGCGKMCAPVVYIAGSGKISEFCSYSCFKKVRK